MTSGDNKKAIAKRLSDARMRILFTAPFFGSLLLHMKFALAKCNTAATDMKYIYFDPEFAERLSDDELDFVLKHEVLHCALKHCLRSKKQGLNRYLYNIAADIVINSYIMEQMGVENMIVDGEVAMHKAPNGIEGCKYTAEEVYDMLYAKHSSMLMDAERLIKELEEQYGVKIDDHEIWKTIPLDTSLSDEWKNNLIEAAKKAGKGEGLPHEARALLAEYEKKPKVNWKEVLNDFIREVFDRNDFTFLPPDRRFQNNDFFLPSFSEIQGEQVDNIWFAVDTSGSISAETLTMVYKEITMAIEQFNRLSGKLSFFDHEISDPVDFDSVESFNEIKPVGGGGTSFYSIFRYLKEHLIKTPPTAIVVLTDGYATYPPESMAMDIPVLWMIIDNETDAPWGVNIHIDTEG